MAKQIRLASLDEASRELDALERAASARPEGPWSLGRILGHCAASIEYSLTGYPKNKPAIVRATIGRLVLARFLSKGTMSHDRAADIPGAAPAELDRDEG